MSLFTVNSVESHNIQFRSRKIQRLLFLSIYSEMCMNDIKCSKDITKTNKGETSMS